ncbi:MAG: IS66 family insertion sequence element accessory protein TnpB [Bdellovibrionaceae bacterium]|nr:IS66 family insertion sequence element accessory protein TnpB [Pseudobdellovibrionaceae bacterium]
MKAFNSFNKIYLCREYVDFRKSIDGLAVIVESVLKKNSLDGSLFVFICKDKSGSGGFKVPCLRSDAGLIGAKNGGLNGAIHRQKQRFPCSPSIIEGSDES